MPDVHFWYKDDLPVHGRFAGGRGAGIVRNRIKQYVAYGMDCHNDNGKWITHNPRTQITILTFEPIGGLTTKLAIMHILAFDWPDRMATIGDRLRGIGDSVSDLLDLPEGTLDLQFIPIPRETREQQGCWVNV